MVFIASDDEATASCGGGLVARDAFVTAAPDRFTPVTRKLSGNGHSGCVCALTITRVSAYATK